MNSISVIIPLYNKESSIKETIESVLCQTYSKFEVIIINDGSTDNSLDIVKEFDDHRISIHTTVNQGVSSARNNGVELAQHEHIAFLDADDYWYPKHLQSLTQLIDKYPQSQWYATGYEIEHNHNLLLPVKSPIREKGKNWSGIIDDFFSSSMIDAIAWTSVICMEKDFFHTLGGFDNKLTNGQDTDLWIRAALVSPLCYSNTITATYKYNSGNHISKKSINKKTIIDFDKLEHLAPYNHSLKKYLDYNRFSVAIRYKSIGDSKSSKELISRIDTRSLSKKQLFLTKLPTCIVKGLFTIKGALEKIGYRIRTA